MDEPNKQRFQKQLLVIIGILPLIGTVIYIVKWAFDSWLESPLKPEITFLARIEILAMLIIPLIFGLVAMLVVNRRWSLTRAKLIGLLTVGLIYFALILKQQYDSYKCEFPCGEWNPVLYLWMAGMWIVDAFALIAIGNLLKRKV